MSSQCIEITYAGEQNVTLLNSGASIVIMVNDPYSLVEIAHPLGHSAEYLLVSKTFLADISTTGLYIFSLEASL